MNIKNSNALMKVEREWVYTDSPNDLCYGECPRCGKTDYVWSTYYPFVWCMNCADDVRPSHYGIVDGPVSIGACKIMGINFGAFDLLTHTVIPFDSEFWPNKLPLSNAHEQAQGDR